LILFVETIKEEEEESKPSTLSLLARLRHPVIQTNYQ
jgi:hypothetical protein